MKSATRMTHRHGAVAAVFAALTVAVPPAFAQGMMGDDYGPGAGNGPGMMGGGGSGAGYGPGMMMGGAAMNDRPAATGWGGAVWDYARVSRYLAASGMQGAVDKAGKTVSFSGSEVTIDMVAVQPGHDDGTFEVRGVSNPTLVVPAGATVHLNLVNMDYGKNMQHGVIITSAVPPYRRYVMMQTGPGLAGIAPPLPWRSAKNIERSDYAVKGTTFVARTPGVYWYICQTPGHAEKGMYGKFVVRGG